MLIESEDIKKWLQINIDHNSIIIGDKRHITQNGLAYRSMLEYIELCENYGRKC